MNEHSLKRRKNIVKYRKQLYIHAMYRFVGYGDKINKTQKTNERMQTTFNGLFLASFVKCFKELYR